MYPFAAWLTKHLIWLAVISLLIAHHAAFAQGAPATNGKLRYKARRGAPLTLIDSSDPRFTTELDANFPGVSSMESIETALPIGGKFDIQDNWQSPHISHDQGTAADVAARAGQCPNPYPVNLQLFLQACTLKGNSDSAHTIREGNHVHCYWDN